MVRHSGWFDKNILSWLVISLLLFVPLYPKFPLFEVPGTYVAVRLEDFLIGGVLLIWFLKEINQGWPTLKQRVSRLVLLYFLAGLVSLANALLISRVITPHLAWLHFFRRIEYMSLFFVALASVREKRHILSYALTLFLAAAGVFLFGLGQKYLNWPVISTMNEEFSKGMALYLSKWTRINSTFAGHYDLAAFAVLIFSPFLGFMMGVKRRWLKLAGLTVAVMAFYLLILTASRISFGAYLISAVLVLFWLGKKKLALPLVGLSLAVMLLTGDLGQRFAATFNLDLKLNLPKIKLGQKKVAQLPQATVTPLPPPPAENQPEVDELKPKKATGEGEIQEKKKATVEVYFPEPESVELAAQRSGEIRFKVEWPRAIRAFLKNPLVGTGFSSVTLATDNDYLRILAETGLLGGISFALIFLEFFKKFFVFHRKTKWCPQKAVVTGIAGAMVGFLANAVFIDVFEASKVAFLFWMLMGIMVGTINLYQTRDLFQN
ncbi:MAG: O-antigen ligase family protein [Candidatus Pacebacteria bacterium]|nr:O-antigen ligase family protein [Candidatus Paceibacterota bacterium]